MSKGVTPLVEDLVKEFGDLHGYVMKTQGSVARVESAMSAQKKAVDDFFASCKGNLTSRLSKIGNVKPDKLVKECDELVDLIDQYRDKAIQLRTKLPAQVDKATPVGSASLSSLAFTLSKIEKMVLDLKKILA